jgi:hypothetical protein
LTSSCRAFCLFDRSGAESIKTLHAIKFTCARDSADCRRLFGNCYRICA